MDKRRVNYNIAPAEVERLNAKYPSAAKMSTGTGMPIAKCRYIREILNDPYQDFMVVAFKKAYAEFIRGDFSTYEAAAKAAVVTGDNKVHLTDDIVDEWKQTRASEENIAADARNRSVRQVDKEARRNIVGYGRKCKECKLALPLSDKGLCRCCSPIEDDILWMQEMRDIGAYLLKHGNSTGLVTDTRAPCESSGIEH